MKSRPERRFNMDFAIAASISRRMGQLEPEVERNEVHRRSVKKSIERAGNFSASTRQASRWKKVAPGSLRASATATQPKELGIT
jgi:hypothetical protein